MKVRKIKNKYVFTNKHHFIQQAYIKRVFGNKSFKLFDIQKYINANPNLFSYNETIFNFILGNKNTNRLYNSNLLLDNKTDKYWTKVEQNSFLNKVLCHLNYGTFNYINFISQFNNNLDDSISYLLKLALRTPLEYWDCCDKVLIKEPRLKHITLRLRKKINNLLVEKHKIMHKEWMSRVDTDGKYNIKYGFLKYNGSISVLGEFCAVEFDLMNPTRKKIMFDFLSHQLHKIYPATPLIDLFLMISETLEFSFILPTDNGFIYLKNNYKELPITDDFLKDLLNTFYTSGLYFQYVMMSSLEDVVILNDKEASDSFDCYHKNKQLKNILNAQNPLIKIYNQYNTKIRSCTTEKK